MNRLTPASIAARTSAGSYCRAGPALRAETRTSLPRRAVRRPLWSSYDGTSMTLMSIGYVGNFDPWRVRSLIELGGKFFSRAVRVWEPTFPEAPTRAMLENGILL